MRAEESDRRHSRLILNLSNQPIIVTLDVEHDPATPENACLGWPMIEAR
jgi:hypothetical protein